MIEYEITIKDTNHRLSHKEISYEPLTLDYQNPILSTIVAELHRKFKEAYPEADTPDIYWRFKLSM